MPYSSNSGKHYITKVFDRINPKTVLDVGCGSGTYAKLLKKEGQIWTGVEIHQPYVEKFGLQDLYDQLAITDIRNLLIPKVDAIILGDVLEHMEVEEAQHLLSRCREAAHYTIVSIPLGYYPQDEFEGNPHEKHVTDNWSHEEVHAAFGKSHEHEIENEIGVYVYKRRLKFCVYAISKNEAQFVKRFYESAKDADYVLIADTGSTDETVSLAKECGIITHQISVRPWRFDIARDTALCLVPDVDVCISLDLDEVLEEGWRYEIERVWNPDTTRLRYQFCWGCGINFMYEKIHARHGYHWHHPVHEYPRPDQRITEVYAETPALLVSHYPDATKSRGQYMDLLRLAVKEDPACPRNAFYFARELTFYNLWDEAIEAFKKYLDNPEAKWYNERAYAMRLMGQAYDKKGNQWEALSWHRRAVAEAPNCREPWVDLANSCYMKGLWKECLHAATMALTINDKQLVYTVDPEVWGMKPWDLAAIAAHHLGMHKQALEYGEKAVELSPDDERLKTNLAFYRQAVIES